MEFEIKEVEIKDLVAAPWNPRKEITPESVADLVNDIKENGVLQNIGVWPEPETKQLYVIFGNRRVVACRVLGLKKILAKVFSGTEVEARIQTRSENELRLGIDPLYDSKQLNEIRSKGLTEQEIAAKYGLPIAFVCRRLKLADLAPSIREKIQNGLKITTDALERLSAYPVEIQDKVSEKIVGAGDVALRWSDISYKVNDITLDLDRGFKFDDCVKCPMRTGSAPTLFDEIEDGCLGRCLDPECHKRHKADAIRKRVAAAIDPDVKERVKLRDSQDWTFNHVDAKKNKPDEKNPCAYYAITPDGSVKVKYGPSKAAKAEAENQKREKEKADNAKVEADRKKRIHIIEVFSKWAKANLVAEIKKYVGKDLSKLIDLVYALKVSKNGYHYDPKPDLLKWSKNRSVETFIKVVANLEIRQLGRYSSASDVRMAIWLFKTVSWKKVFTPEEYEFINSDSFKNAY